MLLAKWLLFIVFGRIVIQIWIHFHLPKFLQNEWMEQLHKCDLCSGVWVYSILSFLFRFDIPEVIGFEYVPLVGALITGCIISWLVHLFILGWRAKYEVVVI